MSSKLAGNLGSCGSPRRLRRSAARDRAPGCAGWQIFWHDIFCDDASVGPDNRRQPHDVITASCTDVRDGHPGFDAEQPHELARFAGIVALLFVVPDRTTMSATGRSGFGKAAAGVPDCAMKSWAEADIVKAATKTTTIAVGIRSPAPRRGAPHFACTHPLQRFVESG